MIEVDNVDDHINETLAEELEARGVVEDRKVEDLSSEVIKVPGANSSFMFQQFQHGRDQV